MTHVPQQTHNITKADMMKHNHQIHLINYARIHHQPQVEEISECPISPGPQAAMAVQEDVPLPVSTSVQKPKPHPCDPSQTVPSEN